MKTDMSRRAVYSAVVYLVSVTSLMINEPCKFHCIIFVFRERERERERERQTDRQTEGRLGVVGAHIRYISSGSF